MPVATGWFNDSFVEITSGLKEGDLVLLAPVSDEEFEDTQPGETNHVEAATETNPRLAPPAEGPPADERRFQRRNAEPSDGEAAPERRRSGQGRRPQNPPE